MQYVTLNNGNKMPLEGFGVFQITDPLECEKVVLQALENGYRLIDTAAAYFNEQAVGQAIRKSQIARQEIFVTTKLWIQDYGYDNAKKAIDTCLENLGLEYIDLILLHQAFGDYYGAYRALEDAYKEGKIKAIGVANFYPDRLVDLCMNMEITPAVNQIECHPFFQREEDIKIAQEYGVQIEAWGPFAEGGHNIFQHPVLIKIGEKYGKSAAQVVLRWNIQRGVIVIPKSVHENRIRENIDIWDFELSERDMNEIRQLNIGKTEIIDHYSIPVVKMLNTHKIHE
ncbi:aldo/keto reductase [Faecalicoccus pleomorphus]|uniref:aldo/keto reductase n=1 Tax=Faecalicoccus pleomorphus TaxID=1323 RepID=UPI0014309DA4|nr:aldo/keto reductase [Faecalicoccus pleomorphus]MBM6677554.1 aldo/keto reductase [Faecalicoccus pleomorphus]MBM6765692.1 aldo/keto reductase [Faecalicoccus pleomorphus]MDM8292097.1 aldo/keto reductase [Faecalicoccus pleomorphus]NJE40119.1 aldo/keto reductase [Faecalicoccus pleomorphus]